ANLNQARFDRTTNYSKVKDRGKDFRKNRYDIELHFNLAFRFQSFGFSARPDPKSKIQNRFPIHRSSKPSGGSIEIRFARTSTSVHMWSANGISCSWPSSLSTTRTSVPPVLITFVTRPSLRP